MSLLRIRPRSRVAARVAPADLRESWRPTARSRPFVAGETVRLDGERNSAYRLLGFHDEGGRVVAELFGARAGRVLRRRTVYVERLRWP